MEALTISEGFRKVIGTRKVEHAFFSTYCFEPDFFELEVLPLLLGNPALSSNEKIRYEQLQSLMSDHQNRFAVAYDIDVFNPDLAPHLEVDYLSIRVNGACQHAKIAVFELTDLVNGTTSLMLAAGSFNLTKAGWWENIEVGHWVELTNQYAPPNIVEPLSKALVYFQKKQSSPVLTVLLKQLKTLGTTAEDPKCLFYFSGAGKQRSHFKDFIEKNTAMNTRGKCCIEIVSPFFADDGKNTYIADFLGKFKSVSLLLPIDKQGEAPIESGVYDDLNELPVTWCQWQKYMQSSLGIADKGVPFRKLHAKIYQCLGPNPWVFMGSVNLSYKAFSANVEAGFLLQGSTYKALLIEREENRPIFAPVEEASVSIGDADSIAMPVFHIVFDWLESALQITSSKTGELTFCDNVGNILQCFAMEQGITQSVFIPVLKVHLERSSLVSSIWQAPQQGGTARRNLLVSQRNLFCRPNALPAMGLFDLLRIFQDMHTARRTALFAELAARMIKLQENQTMVDENLPPLPVGLDTTSFFSEFSQVNGAFWMLGRRLAGAAQNKDQHKLLDYYLKGCQPDSLRGVLTSLQPTDEGELPSLVVRYLTLLSVAELLDLYALEADPLLAKDVALAIAKTEENVAFDDVPDKERFLLWIKQKFQQSVHAISQIDSTTGVQHASN